jgi:hypothetical protein
MNNIKMSKRKGGMVCTAKNVKTKPTTVIWLSSLFQKNTIEQGKKVLLLSLTFGRNFSVT